MAIAQNGTATAATVSSSTVAASTSTASVVAGTASTSTDSTCACSCLCGAVAFPAGAGLDAVGGYSGSISVSDIAVLGRKKRSVPKFGMPSKPYGRF